MQTIQVTTPEQVRELARLRWEWQTDATATDGALEPVVEDFAEYIDRFARWWDEVSHYSVGFLAAEIGGGANTREGRAVGMVIARVMSRPPSPGVTHRRANAYINSMYVSPQCRNARVGALLLSTADEYLASVGVTRTVLHPRKRAIPFYERAGYSTALNLMSKER